MSGANDIILPIPSPPSHGAMPALTVSTPRNVTRSWEGKRYVGDWEDDQPHGLGTCFFPSGSYHGEWAHGRRHGQGMFIHVDGSVYEGQWANDVRHGRGRLTYNGNIYEGDWANDYQHGNGRANFAGGATIYDVMTQG